MIVKFTNTAPGLEGNPLYINSDHIVSVFETPTDSGSLKTVVWGGPSVTGWTIEESLSEAVKLINAANSKSCGCK
jgi:hypothetical protein